MGFFVPCGIRATTECPRSVQDERNGSTMDCQRRLYIFTATICTLVVGPGDPAVKSARCVGQEAVEAASNRSTAERFSEPRLLPIGLRMAADDARMLLLPATATNHVAEARGNVARLTSSVAAEASKPADPATGLVRLPAVEATPVELVAPRTIPMFQLGPSAQAGRLSSESDVAEKRRRGGTELPPPPPRLGEGIDESLVPERLLPRQSPFESPKLERLPSAPDFQAHDAGQRFDRDVPIWQREILTRLPAVEEAAVADPPRGTRTADGRIPFRSRIPSVDHTPDIAEAVDSTDETVPSPLRRPGVHNDQASNSPERSAAVPGGSPVMEHRLSPALASRVDAIARKGLSLTLRGALYSARAEFIQALRLTAQGLDISAADNGHSQSLVQGLRALEEAESFLPRGSRLEADMNIASIVQSHRTPVLKAAELDSMTPLVASQEYCTFAQRQLVAAAGSEPAASLALFGLGKIETVMAGSLATASRASTPRAIAYHQAALTVDHANYPAANELGVLLARCGQFEQAREALQLAVKTHPHSEALHNLAVVSDQLGDRQTAADARRQSLALRQSNAGRGFTVGGATEDLVQWMSVGDFVRNSSGPAGEVIERPATTGPAPAGPAARAATNAPWKRMPSGPPERR